VLFEGLVGAGSDGGCRLDVLDRREQVRGDVPLPPVVGQHLDGLAVELDEHAGLRPTTAAGLEAHPRAELEDHHLLMGLHVVQELQPRHDPVVERDQFLVG